MWSENFYRSFFLGIYNVGSIHQTTVEIHAENNSPPNKSLPSLHESNKQLPLSLPAYPSSDSLSCVSLESEGLPLPPPPAPCTPPTGNAINKYP